MITLRKKSYLLCITLWALALLSGCTLGRLTPVEETYEYSTKSKNYVQPAVTDGWAKKTALTTVTEDGTFFCFTTVTSQADGFINAQRTLLLLLQNYGVEIGEMEYYGTDYGYSFSESSNEAAYVALSSVRTWQQVLVTLQAIWGDYTDYGYVYAMANAIADELKWETDAKPSINKPMLDAFFIENPDAVHLLYPTFTTKFASEETINHCKALSCMLFDKIKWRKELAKPIIEQLDNYNALLSGYTQDISVPFTRQTCGYAYYGENVKLRIMTTYAELIIDSDYSDQMSAIYGDYFADYLSVFQTANTINDEITSAVKCFGLEDKARIMTIKWLSTENGSTEKLTGGRMGMYYSSTHTAYVTSVNPYLHEYYHHIEFLLTQGNPHTWHSQAFCEIGGSNSRYPLYRMEKLFTEGKYAELFYACTGRAYQSGRDDYYETCDIICYIANDYDLDYNTSGPINSLSRYLIDRYGEAATCQLMLYPETILDVTGKSWEEWETEWKQHIQSKYADAKLPDWVDNAAS